MHARTTSCPTPTPNARTALTMHRLFYTASNVFTHSTLHLPQFIHVSSCLLNSPFHSYVLHLLIFFASSHCSPEHHPPCLPLPTLSLQAQSSVTRITTPMIGVGTSPTGRTRRWASNLARAHLANGSARRRRPSSTTPTPPASSASPNSPPRRRSAASRSS